MLSGDRRLSVMLVVPSLVVVLAVFAIPMAMSFRLSLFDYNLVTGEAESQFRGIDNYLAVLTSPRDLNSLQLTLAFSAASVSLELVLGTCLALALHEYLGLQRLTRTIVLLPMMISPLIAGLMWFLMWNTDFGVVNAILDVLHIPRQYWLGPNLAFLTVVMTEVWQFTPFVVMLVLAGLASLDEEPFEAAAIDGASYIQTIAYITLPMLRSTFGVIILFRTMFALRSIEAVFVLTAGGPADATMLYGLQIYRTAFSYFDLGSANALSWILMLVMVLFAGVYLWVLPRASLQRV